VFFGLALAIAVVAWGTCYKMEQYPSQGLAFRVMSPAKLLTEKERPVRASSSRTVLPSVSQKRRPMNPPAWIAFAGRSPLNARLPGVLAPAALICNTFRAELTYFSFRPPPRFLS
jgi:hypothetical protein